jgi:hypothetical protein
VGGPDGGVWIDLLEIQPDGFSATIYHETGILWVTGRFVKTETRLGEPITDDWLKQNISAFDGTDVLVRGKPWTFKLQPDDEHHESHAG